MRFRLASMILGMIIGSLAGILFALAIGAGNPTPPPPPMPAPTWTAERCQPVANPLYRNGTDCP